MRLEKSNNIIPCANENSGHPNNHWGNSVVELEHPVVNRHFVWGNKGGNSLAE